MRRCIGGLLARFLGAADHLFDASLHLSLCQVGAGGNGTGQIRTVLITNLTGAVDVRNDAGSLAHQFLGIGRRRIGLRRAQQRIRQILRRIFLRLVRDRRPRDVRYTRGDATDGISGRLYDRTRGLTGPGSDVTGRVGSEAHHICQQKRRQHRAQTPDDKTVDAVSRGDLVPVGRLDAPAHAAGDVATRQKGRDERQDHPDGGHYQFQGRGLVGAIERDR